MLCALSHFLYDKNIMELYRFFSALSFYIMVIPFYALFGVSSLCLSTSSAKKPSLAISFS